MASKYQFFAVAGKSRLLTVLVQIKHCLLSTLRISVDTDGNEPPYCFIRKDQIVCFLDRNAKLLSGVFYQLDKDAVLKLHVRLLSTEE